MSDTTTTANVYSERDLEAPQLVSFELVLEEEDGPAPPPNPPPRRLPSFFRRNTSKAADPVPGGHAADEDGGPAEGGSIGEGIEVFELSLDDEARGPGVAGNEQEYAPRRSLAWGRGRRDPVGIGRVGM